MPVTNENFKVNSVWLKTIKVNTRKVFYDARKQHS